MAERQRKNHILEQRKPVTEAMQTTIEMNKKNDLFSKFWFNEVLGRPIATENKIITAKDSIEKRKYLNVTFYERVRELVDELGVPKINSNNVAEATPDTLQAYADPFLKSESKLLTDQEKKETQELLDEITDIEGRIKRKEVDAVVKADFDSENRNYI